MDGENSGGSYALSICRYIARHYSQRGIEIYREVALGKSIIGKDRRVDIFVLHRPTNRALAIECKFQNTSGTTDEKIPYTIGDVRAMRMPACVVYGGDGFSDGVLHLLRACEMAARCRPGDDLARSKDTIELDHILAMTFDWWDLIIERGKRFSPELELLLPGLDLRPVVGKRRDAKLAAATALPVPLARVDEK